MPITTRPVSGWGRRRAAAAVAIAVAATACGADDATTDQSPTSSAIDSTPAGSSDPAVSDPIALPDEPTTPVVTIGVDEVVVTADGSVYRRTRPGPHGFGSVAPPAAEAAAAPPAEPGPAPYEVARLTEAGLAQLFADAAGSGLVAPPPDYGHPGPTDQGTFTVVVTTADDEYRHALYAPGELTGDDDTDAARDRLADFVDLTLDLEGRLGEELSAFEPFEPDQWRVELDAYAATADVRAWPLGALPPEGCTTFAADDFVDSSGGRSGPDPVSGVYETEQDDLVVLAPVMPWQECP